MAKPAARDDDTAHSVSALGRVDSRAQLAHELGGGFERGCKAAGAGDAGDQGVADDQRVGELVHRRRYRIKCVACGRVPKVVYRTRSVARTCLAQRLGRDPLDPISRSVH